MTKTYITLFICFFTRFLPAETVFSSFGIGIPYGFADASQLGMGSVSMASADKYNINRINPAANYQLDETAFSIQYFYENINAKDKEYTGNSTYSNFDGFSFFIPFASGLGLQFGLMPETRIDYGLTFEGTVNTAVYEKTLQSSGGLNTANISIHTQPFKSLSLAITGLFYFGKMEDTWRLNLTENDKSFQESYDRLSTYTQAANIGIGLHFHPSARWSLGAVYRPSVDLNTETSVVSFTKNTEEEYDGTLTWPGSFGVGAAWSIRPNWVLGIDFTQTDWTAFQINQTALSGARSVSRYCIGTEWRPTSERFKPYIQRIAYRAGLILKPFFMNDPAGKSVDEIWGTLGFGLPLFQNKSHLNFSLAFGKRGNLNTNGLRENLFRLSVSVSGSEKWFVRSY